MMCFQKNLMALVVMTTLNPSVCFAQKFTLSNQDRERVLDELVNLNEFYADVPSATLCHRPRSSGEKLICRNGDLQIMELVHARGAAYAEENAGKQMVNHQAFIAALPTSCKSEECVADFFRRESDDALGGESPYTAHETK